MGRTALQSNVVRKSAQGMGEWSLMYHVALCVCSLQPSACKVSWARSGSSPGSCCLGPWKLERPLRTVICKNLLTFRNTHFPWSCHPTLGISPAETKALECKAIGTGCLLSLVCGGKSLEATGKSIGTRKVEEVNDIHLFGISTF